MQHPDSNGVLLIRTPGICRSSGLSTTSHTISDVTLVYSSTITDSVPVFKHKKIEQAEAIKNNKYKKDDLQLDLGFAPMVMDSIGRIGASALRSFKRTADFVTKGDDHSSSQTLNYYTSIYHRLRLQFLRAGFEAFAERLIRGPSSQMKIADDPSYVHSFYDTSNSWSPFWFISRYFRSSVRPMAAEGKRQ